MLNIENAHRVIDINNDWEAEDEEAEISVLSITFRGAPLSILLLHPPLHMHIYICIRHSSSDPLSTDLSP